MHGEFVSVKQRPVQVGLSFIELNQQLPEFLQLGKPDKRLSLALQQLSPWFSHYNPRNSTKSTSPYIYIGGIVAVYLSMMAATMIGTSNQDGVRFWRRKHSLSKSILRLILKWTIKYKLMQEKMESKKVSNDQELIQSDPISCPQNQKGK